MSTLRDIVSLDCKLKVCKTCKESLLLTDFYKEPKSKDRLSYSCKKCYNIRRQNIRKNNPKTKEEKDIYNEKNRIWYWNNREKKAETAKKWRVNSERTYRNIAYKYKYNITIDEYENMLTEQNSCCAICKVNQSNLDYNLVVDHCHSSNTVRGLLCRNCNLAIGYFKDNSEFIKNSICYLEKYK